MKILLLIACLFLVGCPTTKRIQLPEKGTTDTLSLAESELDAATDARLSKIAASIKSVQEVLEDVNGKEVNAALWELEITEALSGNARLEDSNAAESRMAGFLGDNAQAAYNAAMKDVEALKSQIKASEQKYELEKAKKNAEYLAKLAQMEAESKIAINTLAAERAERRNDWMFLGGTMLALAGVGLMFATPAKRLGAVLVFGGALAFSIPYIVNEPWFKQAIGWTIGITISSLFAFIYISRRKEECPPPPPDKDDPTSN